MEHNTTTAARPAFDLFVNASGSRAHLAPAAGGAFICGTAPGRSKWACHAVNIPGVLAAFPCAGCAAAAPHRTA